MKINNEFNLGANEGSPQKAQNYFIIVHETANSSATGRNEATYMKRNWRNAYTTDIIGDKGIDYRVGEWGYVSWGALNANPYAPVQIELQHSLDKATFQENYKAYIELIRKACDTFGIPKTLDSGGQWTKGVKSHDWVSKNWGGDHTDPYGYLAKMGISKAQFAKDIANGLGGNAVSKPQEKNYYQSGNYFVALQDLKTYNRDFSKVDNTWFFKKGSKFAVREIVKMPNGATHAQVAGLGNTYVTLAKSHVKPQ